MGMPKNIEIIDTMIGLPSHDRREIYKFLAADLRDEESGTFTMPAQYMFKDIPAEIDADADPVAVTLYNMDRFGVARAMINVGNPTRDDPARAARTFPDRFLPCLDIDPRNGVEEIRRIRRYHDEFGLVALTTFPAGCRTSINAAPYYPIYATCVELDIPIFVNVGVPGPRIPLEPQKVEHLDEVCWFFPELKVVMRHGAEPWEELAVKLMLKWPNLYYSTSAFAPRYYPRAIIDYANTRGADKVIYAGYFPAGLTYERIMSELPDVPLKDEVWPKFLRDNAARVLGLD
ncbi:MAG TPA: amidohydrolase family protein [Microthrixaceae bacterium]|nr:amidohydrolase family protein [Microthrixaceae bacterium]HRW40681.1 amidohydrolase family protein [Microthrixaceae bacterium]